MFFKMLFTFNCFCSYEHVYWDTNKHVSASLTPDSQFNKKYLVMNNIS